VQPIQVPPGIPRRRFDLRAAGRRVFGARPGRRLYLLIAGVVFVFIVWAVCAVYVRPNEFAVKQVTVGRHKGILPEVYYPGLHFVSPGTERLHVFSTDIQSLDLTNDPKERPKDDKRVTPAINIQTSGTRKEEKLFSQHEYEKVKKLRGALFALKPVEAMERLLKSVSEFKSNAEFFDAI